MLNPFFIYALVWILVLSLHELKWSGLYTDLTINLKIFFIITIIFSLIFGILLRKKYKNKLENLSIPNEVKILFPMLFIILGHLLQFMYVGKIPLVENIKRSGYMYTDFLGIKTFHVILLTFNSYYSIYLIYIYLKLKKSKYFFSYLLCLVPYMLLYLRGSIITILFTSLIIYLSSIKLTIKKISILGIIFFIAIYIFGITGNKRHYYKWNDTSYLNNIAKNTRSNKYIDPLFWGYIYISSPIANLQKNLNETEAEYSLKKLLLENMLPDFIQKRFFEKEIKIKLISPNLNVSTGFLSQYVAGGILGMYIMFFIYSLFNIICTFALSQKSIYYIPMVSILSSIVTFSFFVNMYVFSGLSFQLVYPFLFNLCFEKIKIKN
ncbi:MAG: oligosaccharide repeat unit polymerase [Cetobacterium sp.]|uniref:oligosaccharide repeat unit polymerase n=1 Tax=Cetobacterium sp. TaxID=2071632 RepID=UPI003F2B0F6C